MVDVLGEDAGDDARAVEHGVLQDSRPHLKGLI